MKTRGRLVIALVVTLAISVGWAQNKTADRRRHYQDDKSTAMSATFFCTWAYESQQLTPPTVTHSQPIPNSDLSGTAEYQLTIGLSAGHYGGFTKYP
jgi:hypothetical protein